MNELYKPVLGWEEIYEVSNFSRCRSLRTEKLLKSFERGSGYLMVGLWWEGRRSQKYLHRMVWEAFNGPIPDYLQVRHGPAQGEERHCLSNLSLGTRSENENDKIRDGTHNRGARNGKAVLTETEVKYIKQCLKSPYQGINTDLGRKFGVHSNTIGAIRHGRIWAHV